MIYKNSEVHFDVNSQIKRSVSANIQFSTQDIDTAKLTFSLTKDGVPLPISQATHGKLFMRFADGSKFYVNTEVQDALGGVIFYVLTPDQVTHYGTVQAELYVNYDNGQKLSVHKFSFEIDRALVDQDIAPVAEYYIDDFESLKAAVQEMADDAERVIAELQKKFENLDNIETKEGAQEKADAAEAEAKAYTDVHADKIDNPHKVTKAQVGLSNVDNVKQASKADFDKHTADNVRHISADERIKWSAGQLYKITEDSGDRKPIPDGTDLLSLPSGLYYGVSNKVVNSPEPNAVEWFHYDVSTNGNKRKTIVVTATANPKRWFGTIHTDGSFKGWQRFITDADIAPAWNAVTLINGSVQDPTYPLKFSISNNVLWLRGSFGKLPAIGTSVAKFAIKPTQTVDFVVPTIGAYGTARFSLTTDGDLKYDGMLANDNASVSRVSFTIGIPLW